MEPNQPLPPTARATSTSTPQTPQAPKKCSKHPHESRKSIPSSRINHNNPRQKEYTRNESYPALSCGLLHPSQPRRRHRNHRHSMPSAPPHTLILPLNIPPPTPLAPPGAHLPRRRPYHTPRRRHRHPHHSVQRPNGFLRRPARAGRLGSFGPVCRRRGRGEGGWGDDEGFCRGCGMRGGGGAFKVEVFAAAV